MCYVLVKKFNKHDGCVAFQTKTGAKLVKLKSDLEKIATSDKDIEIVVISRPSVYLEYAPYRYVKTSDELIDFTKKLVAVR